MCFHIFLNLTFFEDMHFMFNELVNLDSCPSIETTEHDLKYDKLMVKTVPSYPSIANVAIL